VVRQGAGRYYSIAQCQSFQGPLKCTMGWHMVSEAHLVIRIGGAVTQTATRLQACATWGSLWERAGLRQANRLCNRRCLTHCKATATATAFCVDIVEYVVHGLGIAERPSPRSGNDRYLNFKHLAASGSICHSATSTQCNIEELFEMEGAGGLDDSSRT
jgi:hypothetical protein